MGMSRNDIIQSLINATDAESDRICNRLQQCNVRIVYNDGSIKTSTSIRTRLQAAHAMQIDDSISRIEYDFNNVWKTVYCS